MERQLSPADVGVAFIETQIAEQKKIVASFFAMYKVETLEGLEDFAKSIADTKARLNADNSRLSMILGIITFEELEAAATTMTSAVRFNEEIKGDIFHFAVAQILLLLS